MIFTRKHRHLFALALLVASLFAQGAIAASGCLMPGSSLRNVIAGASNPHCDSSQSNPNLCLIHSADQSDNNGTQLFAVASAPPVVMLVLPPPPAIALPRQNSQAHSPPTDPPIPIRNCCFRI